MEPEVRPSDQESIPEPEEIVECRKIISRVLEMVDAGEVESVSCYVEHRDGTYRTMQSQAPGRHEDAGRLFELAIQRLGYVDRQDVQMMIDKALE